jgi:iron(III) transport system ATP-binding protein
VSSHLSVHNLRKSFDSDTPPAVDGIDFNVEAGEVVVLLGPSGCGKTTTLRMVAGLEEPTAGEIRIGGRTVYSSDTGARVPAKNRDIGMVFQSYAVWPHMTVFGNVAYPLRRRGLRGPELSRKVEEALAIVGLEAYAQRSVVALSGGQMQRVALARALAYSPKILLLDEPLSNLDAKLRIRLRDDLRCIIKAAGLTALYVTHDQSEAVVLGDRIAVMSNGRILQMSAPLALYNNPADLFVASFTGVSNLLPCRWVEPGVVELSCGSGTRLAAPAATRPSSERDAVLALRPENITLAAYAGPHAPADLTGTIVSGQFHGSQSVYRVDVEGTAIEVLELGTAPRFVEGERVAMFIPEERRWVLPASGEAGRPLG